MMGGNVKAYMSLWESPKPVIAGIHGYCVGGGTDMVLCADQIIAAEDVSFGYPPSRVWGTPTTALWVYRVGLERAKRLLLTGDAIDGKSAAAIGLVGAAVPAARLDAEVDALAGRMAQLPINQLIMLKLLVNQTFENMGLRSTQLIGTCSTARRATPRKASPGATSPCVTAFAKPCAGATVRSETTARRRRSDTTARSGVLTGCAERPPSD